MDNLIRSLEAMQINSPEPISTPNINVHTWVLKLIQENNYLKNEIQRLQTLIINQKVIIPNWVH